METVWETRALSEVDADVVVVGIFQDDSVAETLKLIDSTLPAALVDGIAAECKRENFTGRVGQTMQLATFGQIPARKIMLRGLGKAAEITAGVVRKAAAGARRSAQNCESAALALGFGTEIFAVQAAVEGWVLGGYKFTKYKTKDEDKKNTTDLKTLRVVAPSINESVFKEAVRRAVAIAEATNFARDLIAEPAAYMTPTRLAEVALETSSNGDGPADDSSPSQGRGDALASPGTITVEVLNADDAAKLGMGAFLGVAKGAKEPAKFIVLRYSHPNAKKTVALAGKGITFDSGGLSIKTSQGMENMKYDMSGAAAVLGTMRALHQLQPAVNVFAVAAATENMPGDGAMHPGDVLRAMNGKTIEVNNTDAEGRLVLADALSYLAREKPDEIIDLATLTGAVVTALGRAAAGIMGNNDALVQRVIAAGSSAGERFWQLPLFDDYKDTLKSDIADLKNAGARGEAPTSSAAMFLKEFVEGIPWVHLDIAGPAWLDKDKDELNKGGTAFGVRTLCYYLLMESEL